MNGKVHVGAAGPIRTSARDLMALVSGGRRLEVLLALSEGERSAAAVAERLHMRPPHVSQSLAALIDFGLVKGRHEGTQRFYRLTESAHVRHASRELVVILAGTDHTRVTIELHDDRGGTGIDAVLDYVRDASSFSPQIVRLNGPESHDEINGDECLAPRRRSRLPRKRKPPGRHD
jgi:DNA-binding transcriptional ArsR family regulator